MKEGMTAIHEIWIEGYLATGMEGVPAKAHLLGKVEAQTFAEACDQLCSDPAWQEGHGNYDRERGTVWARRLFNNEADARKAFG